MEAQANILGRRIRHFRIQRGLTQKELGEMAWPNMKVGGGYLSYVERNQAYPGEKKLQALADAMGVGIDELRQELKALDPKTIKWQNCLDIIPTLDDRLTRAKECKHPPTSACYLDSEHEYLDDYATEQLQMFGAVTLQLRPHSNHADKAGKDVGYIKRGVYHPGKDLDIRECV